MKDDVETWIERGMLRWFGHIGSMYEYVGRLPAQIYGANVNRSMGRGRSRRVLLDEIGDP